MGETFYCDTGRHAGGDGRPAAGARTRWPAAYTVYSRPPR